MASFLLRSSFFHTIRPLASSEATAYYRPAPSRTDSIPERDQEPCDNGYKSVFTNSWLVRQRYRWLGKYPQKEWTRSLLVGHPTVTPRTPRNDGVYTRQSPWWHAMRGVFTILPAKHTKIGMHTIRPLASSEATAYYRPAPSRTDSIPERDQEPRDNGYKSVFTNSWLVHVRQRYRWLGKYPQKEWTRSLLVGHPTVTPRTPRNDGVIHVNRHDGTPCVACLQFFRQNTQKSECTWLASSEATAYYRPAPSRTDSI